MSDLHDVTRLPANPIRSRYTIPTAGGRPSLLVESRDASAHVRQHSVASRIGGFAYAIRNIVAGGAQGRGRGPDVRYLNIGDPIIFGFSTPPHLVEAVARAIRDGHNGYAPSVGLLRRAKRLRRSAGGGACRSIRIAS